MFYKMTPEFIGDLKSLLGEVFADDELSKGIEAFENLINIAADKTYFDQNYGEFLNRTKLYDPEWDVYTGCRLEEFLRKIETIKGTDTEGLTLNDFYVRLGLYLDEEDVTDDEEGLQYSSHYVVAYRLRNRMKTRDNTSEDDYVANIEKIKSLFVVYIHQCIINYELINASYERELLEDKIDYAMFVKSRIESLSSFEQDFMQLDWFDETNELFSNDFRSSVKFIGEAGMGKTTQMKKMFLDLVEQVSNGNRKILPIWIDLSELSELEDVLLETKIKQSLGEYEQYYSILLRSNAIALFLDGYNEVLTKDMQDIVKRKLASDIDEIHTNFPEVFIAMTDRCKKSNPPCLQKNIAVYTFNGLSRDEMTDYIKLKADPASVDSILAYIDSDNSNWLDNSTIIPAKMNSLISLMSEGITPEDEDDFYDKYLDFILEREELEKKETRIDDLKYLLYVLAQEMNHPTDEKNQNEIIKLWLSEGHVGDLAETRRLFKLAVELPVLVPGSNDKVFKFAYPQYFYKLEAGF